MISYLATLAPALMAFTASAQMTYNIYADSQCSGSIILTGSIELDQCTPFSTPIEEQPNFTGALEIDGNDGVSCNIYNLDCSGDSQWPPMLTKCNPLIGEETPRVASAIKCSLSAVTV